MTDKSRVLHPVHITHLNTPPPHTTLFHLRWWWQSCHHPRSYTMATTKSAVSSVLATVTSASTTVITLLDTTSTLVGALATRVDAFSHNTKRDVGYERELGDEIALHAFAAAKVSILTDATKFCTANPDYAVQYAAIIKERTPAPKAA